MRMNNKIGGTVKLFKLVIFSLFIALMLTSVSSTYADNLSMASQLDSNSTYFNNSLEANYTITNSSSSEFGFANGSMDNLLKLNLSKYNTSLDFSMVLMNAYFVNETHINFTGEINLSQYVIDEAINYSETFFAPVNISIFANINNITYDYNCEFSVNGTSEFGCIAPNSSEYTVIAATNFKNQTLYRYAVFDNDEMYRELINKSKDEVEEDEYIFGDNLSMYVKFEEAYTDGRIFGSMISNANTSNNRLVIEMWPINRTHSMREKKEVCELFVSERDEFDCKFEFMDTGTYEINMTLFSGNESYSVKEITYYLAPEYRIRVVHEGLYRLGDIVKISGYATLANTLINESMAIIVVDGPGNMTYKTEGINPELEFMVDVPGEYMIDYYSYFRGKNYSRTSKIVVAEPERFGLPKEKELNLSVKEIYPDDYELLIPLKLENVNIEDVENKSIVLSITEIDSNTSLEMKTRVRDNNAEVVYFLSEPGSYTVEASLAELNLTSIRNVTAIAREEYALEFILNPLLEKVRERNLSRAIIDSEIDSVITPNILNLSSIMNISNTTNETNITDGADIMNETKAYSRLIKEHILLVESLVYNRSISSYNLNLSLGENAFASLRGIPEISSIRDVSYSETNDSRISTNVFAVKGIDVEFAEIHLEKSTHGFGHVEAILHCNNWDYELLACEDWKRTNIRFIENETHIIFNATSFSAYAGGEGFNSQILVWDITDVDYDNKTGFVTENIKFFANFTQYPSNLSISSGICEIEIEGLNRTMVYNSSSGLYWYNTTFSTRGNYDYIVYCNDATYDDMVVENNLTIYSKASISSQTLTRDSITLGYPVSVSCEIEDIYENDGIFGYNVSFHSSLEGEIGWQTTDVLGWSSVTFTPEVPGDHIITCGIEDYGDDYYVTDVNELFTNLNVELSRLRIAKTARYNDSMEESGAYNIIIEVENYGLSTLFDVFVADFVPDGFTPHFTVEPIADDVFTINGISGTLYLWEIESLEAQTLETINYNIVPEYSNLIYDISDSYIMGGTYDIN